PVSALVHPDYREVVAERGRLIQQEGRTPPRDYQRCLRLDGTPFEIEVVSAPILWHGVRASLTVIRDISEQRRSERLEARYALLNENVRDPMLLVRLDGRIVEANPAAVAFYGYSVQELLQREIFDLRPSDPRDAIAEQMQKARREGIFLETVHVRKDGRPIPVEVYARKVSVDDEEMLLSVIRDVSVRKEAENRLRDSEEKWRSIINASPDAIMVVSLDGVIQQASRRVFELWGFDPDRDVLGRSMFDLLVPEDQDRARGTFGSILRGQSQPPALYHGLRKDGRRRAIEVNREVLRDPRGRPTGLVIVLRDVSDRVALEAQLRQAQKMESVGRLAGGIAHDFNNLLQVILGNAQDVLESTPASAPQRGQLLEVLHAGARSAELTRQLLAFARRQDVVPRVVDLNEAVSRALKMLRRLIGEDIELVWKPGPSLWNVKIDPAQVDQALANLASNSRDAIAGVGTLTVSTGNQLLDAAWCRAHDGAEPGEYVRLSVRDDGAGMGPEVQAHLFEPFFTTKGVGQGTGLGLATVYGIVKQGRGFLDVESRPGEGATFTIYLPRTAEAAPGPARQPDGLSTRGNETILVVEDEASILLMLQRALAQLGYTVIAAHSPAEALRAAEEHPGTLHLLLTDVVMPGMNGRQLVERVAQLRPGVRALFMSGHTAEVISQRGVIEEGMPFIQKPFATAALASRIREILGAPGS
ncbi:MAG TPA: PAS domain S-box protein, partial [Spirochaetia bacterium]|nr:PAS domain S-box protein [Spirochaetia bacterium]